MAQRKSLLVRIYNWFIGKAHSVMDEIENKIELMEQKITELENGYAKAIDGLTKVSALEIKYRGKSKMLADNAKSYHKKAEQLKEKMDSKELSEKDAQKHIILMLNKEEQMKTESGNMKAQADNQKKLTDQLEGKIKSMKQLIENSKNQISTLKVQKETAEVNKAVSKELSSVNMDGITSHIDDIEEQIASNNAEAEAWGNLDDSLASDEERINKILNEPSATADDELLAKFLKK